MDYVDIKYEWMYDDNSKRDFYNYIMANWDAIMAEVNKILMPKMLKKIQQVIEQVISEWYGSYGPSKYSRVGDMYNVPKVYIDGDYISAEFDSGAMGGHRMPADKLYDLTFKQGLHGGPVWRYPDPYFTYPLREADSSTPPYSLIESKGNQCIQAMKPEAIAIFRKIFARYVRNFNN